MKGAPCLSTLRCSVRYGDASWGLDGNISMEIEGEGTGTIIVSFCGLQCIKVHAGAEGASVSLSSGCEMGHCNELSNHQWERPADLPFARGTPILGYFCRVLMEPR